MNTDVTLYVHLNSTHDIGLVDGLVNAILADAGWAYGPGDFDVVNHGLSLCYCVNFAVDGSHSQKLCELYFKSVTVDGVAITDVYSAPCA